MGDHGTQIFADLTARLDEVLRAYVGKVEFGCVRRRVSEWEDAGRKTGNIAITYESPGGSTNQLNITFDHEAQTCSMVDAETGDERRTADVEELLQQINAYIARVPEIRMARLRWDIDRWHDEGWPQARVFAELNKMLQMTDLKGGSITQEELNEGTRYYVSLRKRAQG